MLYLKSPGESHSFWQSFSKPDSLVLFFFSPTANVLGQFPQLQWLREGLPDANVPIKDTCVPPSFMLWVLVLCLVESFPEKDLPHLLYFKNTVPYKLRVWRRSHYGGKFL